MERSPEFWSTYITPSCLSLSDQDFIFTLLGLHSKICHKHLRHVLTSHFSLKVPVNCKLSSSHVTRLQLCCVGSVRTRLHFPWESPVAGAGAGK